MKISNIFMGLRSALSLNGRAAWPSAHYPPPRPDEPLAIIGDIHGRDDLLEKLLNDIGRELPAARIICAGDVIDRGPSSAQALRRLRALGGDAVVLRGNHEQMLLDFLDAPGLNGAAWLRGGGASTLGSFGIQALIGALDPRILLQAHIALKDALSDGLEAWLRGLPLFWRSGNVAVVHAGADPRTPIEQQNPHYLMWGHPGFARRTRTDGVWVVHGHTIVSEPKIGAGTVSIDTGAYQSGNLSAALITEGSIHFLSAQ